VAGESANRRADGSGAKGNDRGGVLADSHQVSPPPSGPASISQPETLELEADSVREVRELAEHHAAKLPGDSWWKGYWGRLARALAEDEARLGLSSFGRRSAA